MSNVSFESWQPTSTDFHWKCWDEDAVVFNPLSGDSHRLNLIESVTLKAICDHPGIDRDCLVTSVAQSLEIDADDALDHYISALLNQFEELGLIELTPVSA